jgi:hypothetical protein
VVVAGDFGGDDAVHFLVAAVMRERQVTAEHAAGMGVHHASADRVIDLKTDFIKSIQQKSCPLKSFPIVSSADRSSRKWRWPGPFEACNAYLAPTMTAKKTSLNGQSRAGWSRSLEERLRTLPLKKRDSGLDPPRETRPYRLIG